mmetsp:Transcript_10648/g.14744  ORF Transcript_10648/g.14744 Transcript_10648/m.14744 type:complete len:329 (+) Transcript_10648:80-1066(+)
MLVEEIDQIREIGKNIVSSLLKERRRERTRLALLLECDEEIVDEFLIDFHVKALQTDLREKRYELRQNCIIDHGAFELYWRSAVELAVFNDVSLKRLSRNYVDNKEEAATALEAMQYILPHFAQITKSIEVKELPKHENLSTKYQRWDNFNDDDDDDNDAGFDEQAFARAMASITPQQRAQVAATVGLTPDQLEQFARQMQSMPRDQLRQLLGAFAAGGGGPEQRPRVVRLTREEADAVNRLTELGFSRDDAAQAYLACDKNESLAANLLFDGFEPSHGLGAAFPPASISPPTGGSTDTGGDGGSSAPAPPDNAPGNEDEDDDEDMYS